jgi:prephenate dehydrogenase
MPEDARLYWLAGQCHFKNTSRMIMFKRLVIVGVGLIGGSFALALKRAKIVGEVVGVDRNSAALDDALRLKVIDVAATISDALKGADLVLLAVPVRQMSATFTLIARDVEAHTIVMDCGSTKQDVIAAARATLGVKVSQFVPAHPIAGRETSGVGSADAMLFDGKNVVITPQMENSAETISHVEDAWRACGANVVTMPAAAHDAVFAAVSHLPHMLAFALVDEFAARPNAKSLFSFAASGFRDFTRIAGSSPEMWRDIALNNRDALLTEMDAYIAKTQQLRTMIANADAAELEQLMQRAREARAKWLAGDLDGFRDESA